MKSPIDAADFLLSKASEDSDFRDHLLAQPRETLEKAFGITLAEDHKIYVHEETSTATHVVLPPRSKLSEAQRREAKFGATSLEFLRKTMYDPAPPARPPASKRTDGRKPAAGAKGLTRAGRESIRRGLTFLESVIDENGAWHCIRFNVANPDIPRHFEKPPFISALCVLALESCEDVRAKAICTATRAYLVNTIEPPGLWRYYRHLPPDLDSTSVCSLVIADHPWILLGRSVPQILANRDQDGRFMTWVLQDDEPDVVSEFRIEADPVVNANVIAWLGDHPETRAAQRWLEALITEGSLEGSSKWYPDTIMLYYSVARAMIYARPAFASLRPVLTDRILRLRDGQGEFGNILQTAQAVSALYNLESLQNIDAKRLIESFIDSQHEDGSWPELLAFGDQSLRFGLVGQIGHGSEAVTSAFCIEALGHLVAALKT